MSIERPPALPQSWRTDDGAIGGLGRELLRLIGPQGSLLAVGVGRQTIWIAVRFTDGRPTVDASPPWTRPLDVLTPLWHPGTSPPRPVATVGEAMYYLRRAAAGGVPARIGDLILRQAEVVGFRPSGG